MRVWLWLQAMRPRQLHTPRDPNKRELTRWCGAIAKRGSRVRSDNVVSLGGCGLCASHLRRKPRQVARIFPLQRVSAVRLAATLRANKL